ncbi:MAG: bifunctional adenosylcobinamide kinase/adenosylcobinamide-phosphate guanylyltransferase [Anaerolineae bacterium]
MEKKLILILGGARSGKSVYAEKLATRLGGRVLYVATAAALDEEMRRRIEAHKTKRPYTWRTMEAPLGVGAAISAMAQEDEVILLDCLTLLVSNALLEGGQEGPFDEAQTRVRTEVEGLLEAYQTLSGSMIIVSNEVGLGLVPSYPLGRAYRDLLGWANQWLAREADEVYFMVAGIHIELKALRDAVQHK